MLRSIKTTMQFKIFCTSVLFLLFFQGKSLAQVKFVNEFLNIGVGARAHAMSGSVVASVSDGTAGYWNTAALTELEVPFQINAMHAEWFGGISNYDYFSIAKRLNKEKSSYASLSFIRLGVDDIPNTLNLIGADGSIYVGSEDNMVYAVNPNGSLKWTLMTNGGVSSSPTVGADGGIKESGAIAKALGLGADFAVLGGMLAGTDESPGDVTTVQGQQVKVSTSGTELKHNVENKINSCIV